MQTLKTAEMTYTYDLVNCTYTVRLNNDIEDMTIDNVDKLIIWDKMADYEGGRFKILDEITKIEDDGQVIVKINPLYKYVDEGKRSEPPIGVAPCWLNAQMRIQALSEAITRQIEGEKVDIVLIKRWATEIESQCDLIEYDRCFDD